MKPLVFERAYWLEWALCDRCAGSGLAANPSPQRTPECWNCRGLGRKITRAGRELFAAIAELLGRPVTERESRIYPRHLDSILSQQLQRGMRVRSTGWYRGEPYRQIATIEELPFGQRRVAYWDGKREVLQPHLVLFRELTDDELARVDAFMAEHLGRGAVVAPTEGASRPG